MAKIVKISVTCPRCATKLAVPVMESDIRTKKQGCCPKCGAKFLVPIPVELAPKFESDSTKIGGDFEADNSLVLETVGSSLTAYQSFELTADYYTIGRKNTSGPEFRPDVEVATDDKKMSRLHAAIRKKGKTGFTISQLPTGKNGVFYNGDKLDPDEEMYLSDGDTIRLGDTQFRVNIAEQSVKTTS